MAKHPTDNLRYVRRTKKVQKRRIGLFCPYKEYHTVTYPVLQQQMFDDDTNQYVWEDVPNCRRRMTMDTKYKITVVLPSDFYNGPNDPNRFISSKPIEGQEAVDFTDTIGNPKAEHFQIPTSHGTVFIPAEMMNKSIVWLDEVRE